MPVFFQGTKCFAIQWDHWGIGASMWHWALPFSIRFDYQDCDHLDSFSISFLCFALYRASDECDRPECSPFDSADYISVSRLESPAYDFEDLESELFKKLEQLERNERN